MPKIEMWTDAQAKKELAKRLAFAMSARAEHEKHWKQNEATVYAVSGDDRLSVYHQLGPNHEVALDETAYSPSIAVNYVMKDIRYIHSQLSLNPPAVIPRPTSNDPEDRRRADAADRLVRYAMRQYNMQEQFDQVNLHCLIYGTGILKGFFDPLKGDVADYDPQTEEVIMEGDYNITPVSPWNFYFDPDAKRWEDVVYCFEEILMRYEEAVYLFPDKKELLEKHRRQNNSAHETDTPVEQSALRQPKYDVVRIFQYWEKGTPMNGMIGRFCYHLIDGELLTKIQPNPHAFSRPAKKGEPTDKPRPKIAKLPYNIITDLDIPDCVWGRSIITYAASLQDTVNRIDNVTLDILRAHGVVRLMVPEGTELADDSITNSPYDIVRYSGTTPPTFMNPMPLPTAMPSFRDQMRVGIDDTLGVNESMFGVQNREQSGFAMQYATQQGNIIRRRLFNKLVKLTESVYRDYLNVVKENWKEAKTVTVLGKEKAFEVVDVQGSDVDGGFDIVVEYGTSLSLDPITRREEILTLMPLFEKAGIQPRAILQMLKLNELDGAHDLLQLANDRQREIFEEMIATDTYIPPEELQDHANMLAFAQYYLMTSEFKYLKPEHQELIRRHVKERQQLMAKDMAGGAPQPPVPPMPPAGEAEPM